MIICSLGYGYVAKYLLRELSYAGVIAIGVTSKEIKKNECLPSNLKIYSSQYTKESINYSTHLLITAPPNEKGCPIFLKYLKDIKNSNITNVAYISSTGVYGNYNGKWVNENSELKGKSKKAKNRKLAEGQWSNFCIDHNLHYNIFRLGAIYGPNRLNSFGKKKIIIKKEGHYFSRIHVFDISRLIAKILLRGYVNHIWNLVDNLPSSREHYLLELAKLKNIKKYNLVHYKDEQKYLKKITKTYWQNNKRVSNLKVTKEVNQQLLFPNYKAGLKNLLS